MKIVMHPIPKMEEMTIEELETLVVRMEAQLSETAAIN